jgi:ribosomal protein S3
MRGDIDFARDTARLSYGGIGIKVWIYRGDTMETVAPKKN